MRQEFSIAPAAWLSGAPIAIPQPATILATFLPSTAKVVRFRGAQSFKVPNRLRSIREVLDLPDRGWDLTRLNYSGPNPVGILVVWSLANYSTLVRPSRNRSCL